MKTLKLLLLASAMVFAKPQPSASEHFQTGIGKVYAGYLDIQQALSGDDFQKSKAGTLSLYGLVKAVPAKGLDKAAKAGWDSVAASIMEVQRLMASSKDIKGMRNGFAKLTPLVAGAVEKFGMKSTSPAYLFHCPMHGPHGADWMQKDKTTANPYFGKEMPDCGSLVREVKAK